MNFYEIVEKANSNYINEHRNKIVGKAEGTNPRFELYHAAQSLCSMKVRTVLAEKNIPYASHDLNLPVRNNYVECYLPDYVRMRLLGAPDAEFARSYTGQSSVTTEGFDPCVVPTLVDHEKERIVVDSSKICLYLDEHSAGTSLVPDNLVDQIDEQIALVDQAPHVASLYGAHPDHDPRPKGLKDNITGVHAKKVVQLSELRGKSKDEPALVEAYDAKIAKESAAGEFVFKPDEMRAAHEAMDAHVGELEKQLGSHTGNWVMGDTYTMADIPWTTSIYRMKWLGLGSAWERNDARPRVNQYVASAFDRRSFRSGVLEWPAAYGPSPHVPEFSGPLVLPKFVLEMRRRG